MSLEALLQMVRITAVWPALGGGRLRGNRGQAFYRGGDGWNVSLNDEKGTYFDHRENQGGGILDLIKRVLGITRSQAVDWLYAFAGVEPTADRAEAVREWKQRAAAARSEAALFTQWRRTEEDRLRCHLTVY